jgi:hypothetical protein
MTEIEIYKQLMKKYESLTHILSEMAKYSSCVTNVYMSNLRTIREDEEKELAALRQQLEKAQEDNVSDKDTDHAITGN